MAKCKCSVGFSFPKKKISFLMTTLTFNALVSMKSASPNSSYVWIFNDRASNVMQLTMHFCTELKICLTV